MTFESHKKVILSYDITQMAALTFSVLNCLSLFLNWFEINIHIISVSKQSNHQFFALYCTAFLCTKVSSVLFFIIIGFWTISSNSPFTMKQFGCFLVSFSPKPLLCTPGFRDQRSEPARRWLSLDTMVGIWNCPNNNNIVFGSKRALLHISQWHRWLSLGTKVEIWDCPNIVFGSKRAPNTTLLMHISCKVQHIWKMGDLIFMIHIWKLKIVHFQEL